MHTAGGQWFNARAQVDGVGEHCKAYWRISLLFGRTGLDCSECLRWTAVNAAVLARRLPISDKQCTNKRSCWASNQNRVLDTGIMGKRSARDFTGWYAQSVG